MNKIIFLLLSCIVIEGLVNAAEPPRKRQKANDYPLHEAVKAGNEEQVAALLQCPTINVNEQDGMGLTPLSYTALSGNVDKARLLIEHNADPRIAGGFASLSLAAASDNEAMVRLLLESFKDLVDTKDSSGRTPLQSAVEGGHVSIIRLLLEHGANVNVQDEDLRSPLHYVVIDLTRSITTLCFNDKAIFCLLLMYGANKNLKNHKGKTPLDRASSNIKQIFSESEELVKPMRDRMRAAQLTICSAMHQRLGRNSCLQTLDASLLSHIAQYLQPKDFEETK